MNYTNFQHFSKNSISIVGATEKKEAKDAIDSDSQEIKYGANESKYLFFCESFPCFCRYAISCIFLMGFFKLRN